MADGITITLRGQEALVAHLKSAPDRLMGHLKNELTAFASDVRDEAAKRAGRRSGRLAGSIEARVQMIGSTKVSVLLKTEGVPYALIQERGGRIPGRIIMASKTKALAFAWMGGVALGGKAFYAHVSWPGANIPAKHYIRNTLQGKKPEFEAICRRAMEQTMRS